MKSHRTSQITSQPTTSSTQIPPTTTPEVPVQTSSQVVSSAVSTSTSAANDGSGGTGSGTGTATGTGGTTYSRAGYYHAAQQTAEKIAFLTAEDHLQFVSSDGTAPAADGQSHILADGVVNSAEFVIMSSETCSTEDQSETGVCGFVNPGYQPLSESSGNRRVSCLLIFLPIGGFAGADKVFLISFSSAYNLVSYHHFLSSDKSLHISMDLHQFPNIILPKTFQSRQILTFNYQQCLTLGLMLIARNIPPLICQQYGC